MIPSWHCAQFCFHVDLVSKVRQEVVEQTHGKINRVDGERVRKGIVVVESVDLVMQETDEAANGMGVAGEGAPAVRVHT